MCKHPIEYWDQFAVLYTNHIEKYGDMHRKLLINPVIFRMLGNVNGKTILDAGCGEGYLSRLLTDLGGKVTAVDYSVEMLKIASFRTENHSKIIYLHANLENMPQVKSNSFDLAISNLVIQDLEDINAALSELHRVIKPSGELIFSIIHPCFTPPDFGWIKDEKGKKLYWKIDKYFSEQPFKQNFPIGAPDGGALLFHRTLTTNIRSILNCGFVITDVEEPTPSKESILEFPEFENDLRVCHFIIFKCLKPS